MKSSESGRSFGRDNSEAKLVGVPPGETRPARFGLYRACYHNETVESGHLRGVEPDGGQRTTISFARQVLPSLLSLLVAACGIIRAKNA
jgi:hypothetical protein